MLVGTAEGIYECDNIECGATVIGTSKCPKCPKCKSHCTFVRKLEENERLPANDICDDCKTEIEEHVKVVSEGGIYWRCEKDERHCGVIKPSDFAKEVRKLNKVNDTAPCGVEFPESECPICNPKENITDEVLNKG
jgi:hypothetical protein